MSVALDIILLCIFIITILVGVKRGIVKSAVRFIGTILSLIFASVLGRLVATWIFDTLFRNSLTEKIATSVQGLGTSEGIISVLQTLPDFIVRALQDAGIVASINQKITSGQGQIAEIIVDSVAPVFIGFIQVLAVIIIFMLFMILVRLIANMLDGIFKLPLLGAVNGVLGGVFGLLTGILIVWIVIGALQVFAPMLTIEVQAALNDSINESFLAGLFVGFNPLSSLFG